MLSPCSQPATLRRSGCPPSVLSLLRQSLVLCSFAFTIRCAAESSSNKDPPFGGAPLRGLLGGRSFVEVARAYRNGWYRHEEVWVEVRSSSANAPAPSPHGAPPVLNELTVAVRAKEPIRWIKLKLPERQQCRPEIPDECFGYEFSDARGPNQCDISPWPYDRVQLPASSLPVIDIWDGIVQFQGKRTQQGGFVQDCSTNNTAGNSGPKEDRRSEMSIIIKAGVPSNAWIVFKIKVKNPPKTPITRPTEKYLANTFQVFLQSENKLGTRVLPAPKILSLWMCSYTHFMRTSPCTAKCGGGVRYKVRRLLHPPPAHYPPELLVDCGAALSETEDCNVDPCDADCKLGDWTEFADGPCSATCGQGFQVQRRRIVEGPIGNGKLCPRYDEPEDTSNPLIGRVRYRPCKNKERPDCEQRCDLDTSEILYGACSNVCTSRADTTFAASKKTRTRTITQVVARKERRMSCEFPKLTMQCGVTCANMNFFPSVSGRLPRVGKWASLVLVFFITNNAEELVLEAPKGFEIGKDNNDMCLIKDHNIPNLKRCRVTFEKGIARATFDLYNPLEPTFATETGGLRQPKFEVHFWARSPSECDGGFDERAGYCKSQWVWTLHTVNNEDDSKSDEGLQASYYVFNDRATKWIPVGKTVLPDRLDDQEWLAARMSIEKGAATPIEKPGIALSEELMRTS